MILNKYYFDSKMEKSSTRYGIHQNVPEIFGIKFHDQFGKYGRF